MSMETVSNLLDSCIRTCQNLFSYLGDLWGMLPSQHLPCLPQLNKFSEESSSSELTPTGWATSNTQAIHTQAESLLGALDWPISSTWPVVVYGNRLTVFSEVLLLCRFISNLFNGCGSLLHFSYRYFLLPLMCGFRKGLHFVWLKKKKRKRSSVSVSPRQIYDKSCQTSYRSRLHFRSDSDFHKTLQVGAPFQPPAFGTGIWQQPRIAQDVRDKQVASK